MDRKGLEVKIADLINKRIAEKQPTTVPWIIQLLVKSLAVPKLEPGERDDEHRIALHEGYRQIVGSAIRNQGRYERDPDVDSTLVLPGFERLQVAYSIERRHREVDLEGNVVYHTIPTIVPIERMTRDEAYAKRAELMKLREGLDTHILEWDRYIADRWPESRSKTS